MKRNACLYVEDPTFYLQYGASINLTEHGRLGHLAFSCGTFEEALQNTVKYIRILNRMYSLNADIRGDIARLEMDTIIPCRDLYVCEMEQMMSALYQALQLIPNRQSLVRRVFFKYPRPAHGDRYPEFFGKHLVFGSHANAIEFEAGEFRRNWNYGDPMIANIARRELDDSLQTLEEPEGLKRRIKAIVLGREGGFPRQEVVASELHMTPRTMARYLQRQGTSYQELLDTLRRDLAEEYLKNPGRTIDEVADRLGYSSAANFGRAFKKWTGMPPSEYRNLNSIQDRAEAASGKDNKTVSM
jgi:AraC-like DNA-binding protein